MVDLDGSHLFLPFDLRGRSVLVTGATRGIGRMIAEGFAAAGADLLLCARTEADCAETAAALSDEYRVGCRGVAADVSTSAGVAAIAEAAGHRPLHCLVNNAGATWDSGLGAHSEEAWDQVVNLNLKAPFFLAQAMLPLLRAGAGADWPASIINLGAVSGLRSANRADYAFGASRAALHHLTRSLARTLAPEHIVVNAIAPGPFPSRRAALESPLMLAEVSAAVPRGRIGNRRDIAGLACFLASPLAGYLTGAVVPLDGGQGL
jgi:NAD(P)-dependent dehydrogenase (short-subunit alcohol dehydrogenase family)